MSYFHSTGSVVVCYRSGPRKFVDVNSNTILYGKLINDHVEGKRFRIPVKVVPAPRYKINLGRVLAGAMSAYGKMMAETRERIKASNASIFNREYSR